MKQNAQREHSYASKPTSVQTREAASRAVAACSDVLLFLWGLVGRRWGCGRTPQRK